MRWVFPDPDPKHDLGLSSFLDAVLGGREEVEGGWEAFLAPKLAGLGDPFALPDMEAAVERIFRAIDGGEKITIYGDYDVDGVTSVAILCEVLGKLGAKVSCFLPNRMDEGYGLSADGVARCLDEHGPGLLVAVDCGTTSVAQIRKVRESGCDVIVIDHHECKSERPDCAALVNPMRGDCLRYLCTAGLAFKVSHALLKRRKVPDYDLRDVLDLVAIGTVSDLVPLVGENRVLVNAGIARIVSRRRPGVQSLIEVSGLGTDLNSRDIGFRLGPRLNASGRLATAMESLALLQATDFASAKRLAENLDSHNRERQTVERRIQKEAESLFASRMADGLPAAIVLGDEGWHPGVLGIVASRMMRRHYRPAIIVGFGEDGTGKGSGRSIRGLSLVEALGHCESHLLQFGGHEMAAGLTIGRANFEGFAKEFEQFCEATIPPGLLVPELKIDAVVHTSEIGFDLLDQHDMLEPFGMGNAQPVLAARGVTPATEPRVLKEKHLRIEFGPGRNRVSAIFFNGAENELPRPPWDVAYHLERNTFRGRTSPQMNVLAIRPAADG